MKVVYDIIIVSYNAGEKIVPTLSGVLEQTGRDGDAGYEFRIFIKDGASEDDTVAKAEACLNRYPEQVRERVRILQGHDAGIYDAMNIALDACYPDGESGAADEEKHLTCFLNCGDVFYDREVLRRVTENVTAFYSENPMPQDLPVIFYGDVYEKRTGERVSENPVIDDFACYRHLPCHQACFYDAALFRTERFDTSLKVRADYDHFLKSYYRHHALCRYLGLVIAQYEGGGFSETEENRKLSMKEHRIVLQRYMDEEMIARFDRRMKLTLQPVRTFLAENKKTAGLYNAVRRSLYRLRGGT